MPHKNNQSQVAKPSCRAAISNRAEVVIQILDYVIVPCGQNGGPTGPIRIGTSLLFSTRLGTRQVTGRRSVRPPPDPAPAVPSPSSPPLRSPSAGESLAARELLRPGFRRRLRASPSPVRRRRSRARRGRPGDRRPGSRAAPSLAVATAAAGCIRRLIICIRAVPVHTVLLQLLLRSLASPRRTPLLPRSSLPAPSRRQLLYQPYTPSRPQVVGSRGCLSPPPTPTLCWRSPSVRPGCCFSILGLEELKKKLQPLLFDDPDRGGVSTRVPLPEDTCDSYVVSDGGTVNLLSRSLGEYNINEHGFHKRSAGPDESDSDEKAYRCASHEMHIFGPIGNGASSVVERAIFIPVHRILALKKINIFEKEKRQQILNEMRTLCEACCYPGLVEFQGAFYMPDSGQISIALEYMDGGSLADVIRVKKSIPEPVLSHMLQKVLLGLRYLHEVRHLVHRDIKPANLLVNLKGEAKITDFGVSAGLDNTMAMCATFVGTVTYMSPERIRNENYSYAADIWSLGLTILECATGKFPYDVNEGPANLMLQILDDPSPTPPQDAYSSEFCSFVNDCLQKDSDARPTCEQLLSHPFIKRYLKTDVDLAAYVKSVVNPTERLKQIAEMLAIHYYLLFNGSDGNWHHMKTFYMEQSTFSFSGKVYVGQNDIFDSLSNIRKKLKGDRPREKIVHVVEKLHCRANGDSGVAIRVSGSFIVGNQFLVCGNGVKAEGCPALMSSLLTFQANV